MEPLLDLSRALSEGVGREVNAQQISETETRVLTPFEFPDGDRLVIRLRRLEDHSYEWTDAGHTFMHLSYSMDIDGLASGNRAELLDGTLRRLGVDEREGELVMRASAEWLGPSLLHFAQGLIQVADLRFLSRERVRSTFVDDFRGLLKTRFGERAHFGYVDAQHDPNGDYTIDCLLNESPSPVAVFAVPNDDACLLATITLLKFRTWGIPLFSTAIHEAQEQRSRKAIARLSDAVDKQFSTLHGNEDDIARYLSDFLERGWGGSQRASA